LYQQEWIKMMMMMKTTAPKNLRCIRLKPLSLSISLAIPFCDLLYAPSLKGFTVRETERETASRLQEDDRRINRLLLLPLPSPPPPTLIDLRILFVAEMHDEIIIISGKRRGWMHSDRKSAWINEHGEK